MKISEYISKQTLIIIDEIYLAQQWKEYYLDNSEIKEEEIFMLTGSTGIKEEKIKMENLNNIKIIITTKDTIVSREHILEKINKTVGLTIIDECHCSSAKIFTTVIEQLNSEWTLGLTASPQRDDGLSFLVHNNTGPILYSANIYDSVKLGSSILPELKVFFLKKKTDYPIKKGESYHKTIERIFEDEKVMTFICNRINEHYKKNDSQLCITQKVEESKKLKEQLINEYNIKSEEIAVILGETKTSERIELIEGIKKGTIKIVISSKIFDKGVSANNLNILHNICPSKQTANNIQRCGFEFLLH